jgi:hypothetical protein
MLAPEPSINESGKFLDAMHVEFFVEDLVEEPDDTPLLKKPDLHRLQDSSKLVKVAGQVCDAHSQQGCPDADLSVENLKLQPITKHHQRRVYRWVNRIFDGLL